MKLPEQTNYRVAEEMARTALLKLDPQIQAARCDAQVDPGGAQLTLPFTEVPSGGTYYPAFKRRAHDPLAAAFCTEDVAVLGGLVSSRLVTAGNVLQGEERWASGR